MSISRKEPDSLDEGKWLETDQYFEANNVVNTTDEGEHLELDNVVNIDTSSLDDWTNSGATVDSSVGNPSPSLKVTGGNYAYIDAVGVGDVIEFDVRLISGDTPLCNFYFLCNSSGKGQMLRLDARGGSNYSGLVSTTSWTTWSAPSSGFSVSASTWYAVKIEIGETTAKLFIDGDEKQTFTFNNLGGYIAIHGDSSSVDGANFDNIKIIGGFSTGYRVSNPLALSGTAKSSNIKWTSTEPTDTDIKIYTAISDSNTVEPSEIDYSEATNDSSIPNISGDLTGKYLWVRQELSTEDADAIPRLSTLEVLIETAKKSLAFFKFF